MNIIQTNNRNLETIAWGAIFVWWGITELVKAFPAGVPAIGFGLILLGVNAVRMMTGIKVSWFSMTIGILALVWGALELAGAVLSLPFDLPIFAILLITLGAIVLLRELARNRNQ